MRIYMAGPIFFYGDYLRCVEWATKIRERFPDAYVYSPVENTDINGVEGKKKFGGSQEIANGDNIRLDNTDILIACIDGDVLPSGTCAEVGKFHEKIMRGDNKYIIGVCTDTRQAYLTHSEAKDIGGASALGEQQYSYQNLYVTGLIKQAGVLVSNIDEVLDELEKVYDKYDNDNKKDDFFMFGKNISAEFNKIIKYWGPKAKNVKMAFIPDNKDFNEIQVNMSWETVKK